MKTEPKADEPINEHVQGLIKELEKMSSSQREEFLITALSCAFGMMRKARCRKELKRDISRIRDEILDD